MPPLCLQLQAECNQTELGAPTVWFCLIRADTFSKDKQKTYITLLTVQLCRSIAFSFWCAVDHFSSQCLSVITGTFLMSLASYISFCSFGISDVIITCLCYPFILSFKMRLSQPELCVPFCIPEVRVFIVWVFQWNFIFFVTPSLPIVTILFYSFVYSY